MRSEHRLPGDERQRSIRDRVVQVVRFELRALLVAALACGLVFATSPFTVPAVQAATPRVVVIVGPVGRLTESFRADGRAAARAARAAGAEVVELYSPDATWPAVREALQGASIVVYMGHGNGFPSRYTTVLRRAVQNGFGLNPVAGVDDVAHQYFGEAYIARHVRLAPNAVVLLHHLCYASGNSEPGLVEGDLATGQARVDNFAAGFLAAGAKAVVADAYGKAATYVRRILGGEGTIEHIWRTAPTAHGHVIAFPSTRTPGMSALMDPTHESSGFYRSLVGRLTLRADEVARGAALVRGGPGGTLGPTPTPAPVGPTVSGLSVQGTPTAGARLALDIRFASPGSEPPGELQLGIRWDPIRLDPPSPLNVASPEPSASISPEVSASPEASISPEVSASPEASASPAPGEALIAAETPGSLVVVGPAEATADGLRASIVAPPEPGLYRLVTTIHGADGIAFDATTQDRIPAMLVRVTAALSALIVAPDRLAVDAGSVIRLPVTVTNTGTTPWAEPVGERLPRGTGPIPDGRPELVGRWLRLDGEAPAEEPVAARVTIDPAPGTSGSVTLVLAAPSAPGAYLLVLDVLTPMYGSLTAAGGAPAVIRVVIGPPAAPSVEPSATASPAP